MNVRERVVKVADWNCVERDTKVDICQCCNKLSSFMTAENSLQSSNYEL